MGRPVIGSDCAGNVSVIQHGINGLLFEKGNHHDLSNKILEYNNLTYEKQKIMSVNARKTATIYFNEKSITREYTKLII